MINTIILTVSRDEFLERVMTSIEAIDCDHTRTNMLCIVDGNSNLFIKVRNMIMATNFNEKLTINYKNNLPIKKYDVHDRRKRIADIHKFAQKNLGHCDNIIILEDDTLVPSDFIEKMIKKAKVTPSLASIEGVELSRQGTKCVGAWKFDDVYEPTTMQSAARKENGIENIDAGGFYCILIKRELYIDFNFELHEGLGPDVSFGLEMRRRGYENFIDWSINCTHLYIENGMEKSLYPTEASSPIIYEKKNNNNWAIKY